jgi:hypothetical protein
MKSKSLHLIILYCFIATSIYSNDVQPKLNACNSSAIGPEQIFPAINNLEISVLFPDTNSNKKYIDLQNYSNYKIQIVNPFKNDTIYPNESFNFSIKSENESLLIFSNCIVVDKIFPNDTLVIGFEKFVKFNKLHIGNNYNICVPKTIPQKPEKTSNSDKTPKLTEAQTIQLINDLVTQSRKDKDSCVATNAKLSKFVFEKEIKVKFDSQQSLMIDFFSEACEIPVLDIEQTTNNQLNFTLCDKSLGFLDWEITNKNGKVIARGQLEKNTAKQNFLIYVDGLKSGSYTLTTGLRSNSTSKNFFIL